MGTSSSKIDVLNSLLCLPLPSHRYFAELDFDWTLDLELVKGITNAVIDIVMETVRSFYKCGEDKPKCLVSMRTPYKVNFSLICLTAMCPKLPHV